MTTDTQNTPASSDSTKDTNVQNSTNDSGKGDNTRSNSKQAEHSQANEKSSNAAQNTATDSQSQQTQQQSQKSPEYKKVDIVISGRVYTINCPIGEENELNDAADYINSFIQSIRRQAPTLPHENLLVLCCLNLYEQIHSNEQNNKTQEDTKKHAETLIDKMIKEAQALLTSK